jgi:GPH family glycoside/pentoside/hexuronide:cation symporter
MLTLKEKVGYASGDAACCLLNHPLQNNIMFFATNFMHVPIPVITMILFFCRIFDAVNDLLIGAWVDRTYTKTGKVHPWMKTYLVPTMISIVVMFIVPDTFPLTVKVLFLTVGYAAYSWFYTGINLTYGALLPLMTKDQGDRAFLAVLRFAGVMIGMNIVAIGMQPLIKVFGDSFFGGDRYWGYLIVVVIFTLLGAVVYLFTIFWTKEKVYFEDIAEKEKQGVTLDMLRQQEKDRPKISFFQDISFLIRDKPWVIGFLIMLLSFINFGLSATPTMYIMIYYWKLDEAFSGILSMVNMVPSIIMMYFVPKIIARWGYKGPLALGMVIAIITGPIRFLLQDNWIAITALGVISMPFSAALGSAGIAMISDALEWADWKFDRRLEGLGTAAYSFCTLAGPALGGLLGGILLTFSRIDTNLPRFADQSPDTILWLRVITYIVPVGLAVLQLILTAMYPLTKEKYAQIIKEIAERNAARKNAAHNTGSSGGFDL